MNRKRALWTRIKVLDDSVSWTGVGREYRCYGRKLYEYAKGVVGMGNDAAHTQALNR